MNISKLAPFFRKHEKHGFFCFFSGPFSACSIHVGPCARRPNLSQHAWEGGCWRGSPANARRQGVRAGRVRARQHYTLRRGATQAGTLQRLAALRHPVCHPTSRPTLPSERGRHFCCTRAASGAHLPSPNIMFARFFSACLFRSATVALSYPNAVAACLGAGPIASWGNLHHGEFRFGAWEHGHCPHAQQRWLKIGGRWAEH